MRRAPLPLVSSLLGLALILACGDKDGDGDGGTADGGGSDGGGDGGTDGGGSDGGGGDGGADGGGSGDGGGDTGLPEEQTLYEIQGGEIPVDSPVLLRDLVVVAVAASGAVYVAEPAGGAYGGIVVDPDPGAKLKVAVGDLVTLSATYREVDGDGDGRSLSVLGLAAPEDWTRTGTGTVPGAATVSTADLDDEATAEPWEGVLVRVEDVVVSAMVDGFGTWELDGVLPVDDQLHTASDLVVGDRFAAVTGLLDHDDADGPTLQPRDAADLEGLVPLPCPAEACVRDLADGELFLTEILVDPQTGPDEVCEWVELYNASGLTVDLNGLRVGDNDPSLGPVEGSLLVPPDTYVVLGASSPEAWAIECPEMDAVLRPDAWYGDQVGFSNGGDALRLVRPDGSPIDSVPEYDGEIDAWQLGQGFFDAHVNDDPEFWCQATEVLVVDDTEPGAVDHGTPHAANGACPLK